MKTADLFRMLADSEEELERLRSEAERLSTLATNLRNTDRCPNANVEGSDYCKQHAARFATMSHMSGKPGGQRCPERVPLAAPVKPPPAPDAGGSLAESWRSG